MLTFKDFMQVNEDIQPPQGKTAVFALGRFQPPTRGHKKMIDIVANIAQQVGGDPFIFPSSTSGNKSNPLSFEEKVTFMQKVFPNVNIVNDPSISKRFFPNTAAKYLNMNGYTDLIMVGGSDRIEEYQKIANGTLQYHSDKYNSFEVRSAGMRDPDNEEGISGMSGTKAREAAITGDVGKFRAATGWSGQEADWLMDAVNKGLTV